ncbi:low temperature requirement protein A [Streptomyces galbus]|uniref:low temperature requirement protein A n=1 Tax=Streptomyces galbus TaxID=33898 RepID=UPI001B32A4D7
MQRTSSLALTPPAGGARHASWLELFFDLVAVAGVAQLARLLQGEPDAHDVAVYAVLFVTFWTAWISNTLYGDVAAERTRTRTLLLGMFGLTVMAAAVHGVRDGEHARAFALAYVIARLFANRVWQQRHQRVEGWPAARLTLGVAPWIASLWAVEESVRLWLWTVGLLLDLAITLAAPAGRTIRRRVPEPPPRPPRRDRGSGSPVPVTPARLDSEHLAERLGLFVLIVLGEGVYQLVEAASDTPWDRDLHLTAPAAFLTLTLLWSLCLRRGHGGVPFLPPDHPVTARDAVTATVLYLRSLGFRDIRRADQRPTAGIGLAAPGLLAQVDPSARPASLRDVECLWLTAMTESARCVYLSLAGYADDARAGADRLGVPLFVLDLTGTPRPVNPAAGTLDTDGA